MKNILLILSGLLMASSAIAAPSAQPRPKYNFNSDWLVFVGDPAGAEQPAFDDKDWKKVTLPYAWNEDSAFKVGIGDLPTGVAWYRKKFKLPPGAGGKNVFIEFEGIRHGGEVYLNGEWIGRHENGVMAFGLDLTGKLKPGDNVIAVRVSNAWDYREKETNQKYQWADKNFYANYGGINKNVFLHITDKLHQTLPLYSNLGTTGVYIHAKDFDIPGRKATITAEAEVKNDSAKPRTFGFQVIIEDMDGKVVKTINGGETTLAPGETGTVQASARVEGLNFWSWGYGYLYNVYTVLTEAGKPVDTVATRTGFRQLEFGNGVVKLNGRTIHLKGYAQRSTNEWPALGTDVPPWVSDFSNRLMLESNGNLVRWMHVTPSKQDVESCDRLGLLQAMPAGDAEGDTSGRRWDQRLELMRDAAIYNRNNPSVVMYEAGNKGVKEEHMQQMKDIRDKYDPHGGRAAGSREMLDSKVAEYGGEMLYINKSAKLPLWATEYSRDEGLRKYWDDFSPPFHKDGDGPLYRDKPAPSYNRNQDSHAIENVKRWFEYWLERPGTGERVNAGGVNIIFSDSNTHARGATCYRTSGEVDAMRIPKDNFYAHRVMWDGWVDVEKPAAHIIGHWNYEPSVKKPVYVVSSADQVELFVNGKSKGKGRKEHGFLFTFDDIAWEPGTIRAVGYDANGKQVCEDTRKTAGKPAAIRLTPHTGPGGWRADGADLALVDVEVVDAEGNRCPTALDMIGFSLTGPAEWRGGIAAGPVDQTTRAIAENYILSKNLPVEGGVNRVIVRSMPQAGKVALTAKAQGLKPATLNLESRPAPAPDGLSAEMPDAGLASDLGRGPTPAGESFRMSRRALRIASARAGANGDKAAQSFDDNEETGWSNDNRRETGWIEYELEQPGKISEVTLKLGRFREKSYPLRITIDGKEVFQGQTPQSLGYVTIPVTPTVGKKVGIALAGASVQQEGFGEITEVENQANAETAGGGGKGKDNLTIVEAEIYEKL